MGYVRKGANYPTLSENNNIIRGFEFRRLLTLWETPFAESNTTEMKKIVARVFIELLYCSFLYNYFYI